MMSIKKTIITMLTIMLFSLCSLNLLAQKTSLELQIYGNGGFSFFAYHPYPRNASSIGFNAGVGIGFTFSITQQWGIHAGIGYGLSNVKAKIGNLLTITTDHVDCEGNFYDLHTTLNNYNEIQKSMFLSVPLMVKFQTKQNFYKWKHNKKPGFYAMSGFKTQFLFMNIFTSEITSLTNKAYYPEFDNWITKLPSLELGEFDGISTKKIPKIRILTIFALEAGAKWQIGDKTFLYTGVFFDCGLNDPTKKYRRPTNTYNSAETLKDFTLLSFTNRINYLAVGIKLRLAFDLFRKCKECPY